jgi:hypothetical protein
MQLAAGTMAEIAADSHGSSSDCRGRGQWAVRRHSIRTRCDAAGCVLRLAGGCCISAQSARQDSTSAQSRNAGGMIGRELAGISSVLTDAAAEMCLRKLEMRNCVGCGGAAPLPNTALPICWHNLRRCRCRCRLARCLSVSRSKKDETDVCR